MDKFKEKIIRESDSINSCLNFSKEIDNLTKSAAKKKIALLSSFTIRGLAECLKTKAFSVDIFLDIYQGEYAQWQQEILSPSLYAFQPEAIFILVDYFGPDKEIYFDYHQKNQGDLEQSFNQLQQELFQLIDQLKQKSQAKIIVSNAPKLWPTVMGIFDQKLSLGFESMVSTFNRQLTENYQNDSQVFVFDFENWLANIGKNNFWLDKYFFMADMKIAPEALPILAEELTAFLIPLTGKVKKCLVLDLDNTLWGGVIGEDGLAGIRLAPTGQGQEYYYFQKLLLSFKNKGILLALNSKNNEKDALEAFSQHPYMVLKLADFASTKINWENKAVNLQAIAQELNLGLDSLVFVDDDPVNRELIKETLPEVTVLDLPSDPSLYFKTLLKFKGFNSFEFTEEDKKRPEMYFQEKQRKDLQSAVVDLDSFLKKLGLSMVVRSADDLTIPRIAQLTQKTNQFNLTTFRYQEEDIKKLVEQGSKIWVLEVKDKFGEYGLTGVCIVKNLIDRWEIDSMLLSCRILGKRIEEQFFGFVLEQLKQSEAKTVVAKFRPTAKNSQVKDFYQKFNFEKVSSTAEEDIWQQKLTDFVFQPFDFIEIINK